jgi:hypothetical protein
MKSIPLSRCYVALVDDNDYERISQFKWTAITPRQMVYAIRSFTVNGKRKYEYLHRFIMGVTERTIQVDHRNHNGLDGQRSQPSHRTASGKYTEPTKEEERSVIQV